MDQERRLPRWAKFSLIGLLVITAIFHVAGGVVFADMIRADALEPQPPTSDNGVYVLAIDGDVITLTSVEEREDTLRPGVAGLKWEDGYGQIGEILAIDGLDVTRYFTLLRGGPPPICDGEPPQCDHVDIEGYAFETDPGDVGLAFEEITFSSEAGGLGAWMIPAGDGSVWAIHVHGWRAARREAVRTLPTFARQGITSMVIDYRNDVGAPGDPSGLYRFGRTEWRDLEAAVAHALAHGAQGVVLVGYSTGAAIEMAFMENSDLASAVTAAVFDAPNIDMAVTVRTEAARRSIPGTPLPIPTSLTTMALLIADLRWEVGWGEIAYVDRADAIIQVPTLVFHGIEDQRVPIDVARRLEANAPELVELVEVPSAGHVTSWNVDPKSYESTLAGFLSREVGG